MKRTRGCAALASAGSEEDPDPTRVNRNDNDDRDGIGGRKIDKSDCFETVHTDMFFAVGGPASFCGGTRIGFGDPGR